MIPVVCVSGDTIAEVWEKSIVELWNKGIMSLKESFYGKSFEYIKEVSMLMVVNEPLKEPRVHEWYQADRSFFEKYAREVVEGYIEPLNVQKPLKSADLIDIISRKETYDFKPTYTYHERHRKYRNRIDQISYIIEYLKKVPYTNRAISITWIPEIDEKNLDVPCNIVLWCKVIEDKLVMHTYWRSRDAWRAALPNMYAFTKLQEKIAQEVGVEVGCYVDFSSSYHIYEENFEAVEEALSETIHA